MNRKFLHIFLSNDFITALLMDGENSDLIFVSIHLNQTEHIIETLKQYNNLHFRLVLDNTNVSIKSLNTSGMRYWHQYQVIQRFKQQSKHSDWYAYWKEDKTLIFIASSLTDLEKKFLIQLMNENFLVAGAFSSLWVISNVLLHSHALKHKGIIKLNYTEYFQHVLYLNDIPVFARITHNPDAADWNQFVYSKYKINLEMLDAAELDTFNEHVDRSFPLYALKHLKQAKPPLLTFKKDINVYTFQKYITGFKQTIYAGIIAGLLGIAANIFQFFEAHTSHIKLAHLISQTNELLPKLKQYKNLKEDYKIYTLKKETVECFYSQSFPVLFFLEKISKILPQYGKVIYAKIDPKLDVPKLKNKGDFIAELRLLPFKSAKNMNSIKTELHKVFGSSLRIMVTNKAKNLPSETASNLNNNIHIHITGFIHEIQKLIP